MAPSPTDAAFERERVRTLRLLGISAFAGTLSIRVCDPMLPSLGAEFGRSPTDVSLVVTIFVIAYGLFSLVTGPLGDRRGKLAPEIEAALDAVDSSVLSLG